MTPEKMKEMLPIITAFCNGENVEVNNGNNQDPDWQPAFDLAFVLPPCMYRMAPPKPWYRVYNLAGYTTTLDSMDASEQINKDKEKQIEDSNTFKKWLTPRVYY